MLVEIAEGQSAYASGIGKACEDVATNNDCGLLCRSRDTGSHDTEHGGDDDKPPLAKSVSQRPNDRSKGQGDQEIGVSYPGGTLGVAEAHDLEVDYGISLATKVY